MTEAPSLIAQIDQEKKNIDDVLDNLVDTARDVRAMPAVKGYQRLGYLEYAVYRSCERLRDDQQRMETLAKVVAVAVDRLAQSAGDHRE